MFGIPKEGYGFSSGAEVTMSAPSFSDAVFSYDGGHFQISISLNYFKNSTCVYPKEKCF
jgi:uncharacterized protein (DUF2141 family)